MRVKHNLTLLTFLVFSITGALAQGIAPQSVNSAGVNMSQSNGSLSFTVGELVVLSQMDSDGNTLGSGFTNSAVSSTMVVSIAEPNSEELNVRVYPNPTTDLVFVDVSDTKLEWLYVEVYELQGKLMSSEKYAGITNKIGINTQAYSTGTYMLNLKDKSGKMLGSYKLIKQ